MLPVGEPGSRQVMTGEAVALDMRPTGYLLAAAGAAIDWCVSAAVLLVLVLTIGWAGGDSVDSALTTALVTVSLVIAIVVTPMTVELATRGRSLGRLAVGARIVREDGGACEFRHAFVRALTGVVEIFLTVGGLAALVGLVDPQARRLGDLLAGTYSQYQRAPRPPAPGPALPPELVSWASGADVARLPDRLERRLSSFAREAHGYTPQARMALASELAAEAAPYVYPLPAVAPEVLLLGIVAVRRARDAAAFAGRKNRLERLSPILTGLPHDFPER
jgi:uncharacterized RDD family membrane protein YckC